MNRVYHEIWKRGYERHLKHFRFVYRFTHLAAQTEENMDLKTVVKRLNQIASPSLAESWDNVGLLVEPSPPHVVRQIILTNDLTPPVLADAIARQANLIISYHPPIFKPMKKLIQKQWKDKIIIKCLENKIAVYSHHTAHDCLENGLNDWLISCFDCSAVEPIVLHEELPSSFSHLVKFNTRLDIAESFRETFPDEQQIKVFDYGESSRGNIQLSLQCNKPSLNPLMSFIKDNTPNIENLEITEMAKVSRPGYGMGRKATLHQAITLEEAVKTVKKHLKLEHVRLAKSPGVQKISTVAVCAGSGSSVLRNVTSDLYVTGEMSHHEVLDAICNGTSVILCEHSNTERGYLSVLQKKLQDCFDKIEINVSAVDCDPLEVV